MAETFGSDSMLSNSHRIVVLFFFVVCSVTTLNLNVCSILEKTHHIESSKEIGPVLRRRKHASCRGVVEDQRSDLEIHWPPDWLAIKCMIRTGQLFLENDQTQPTLRMRTVQLL